MKNAVVIKETNKIEMIVESDWVHNILSSNRAIKVEISIDLQDTPQHYLEAILVPVQQFKAAILDSWTNGTDVLTDANDIPTLVDAEGNPQLDQEYVYASGSEEVPFIDAYYEIQLKASAGQDIRSDKMTQLDSKRQLLLQDADISINIKEDAGQDSSALRAYRQALRDVTEVYKDENGWLDTVDSLDIETFVFPTKP